MVVAIAVRVLMLVDMVDAVDALKGANQREWPAEVMILAVWCWLWLSCK